MRNTSQGYNAIYLKRIEETLEKALHEHHRTLAVRVDLRLPDNPAATDSAVISRFTDSLKARIESYINHQRRLGKRAHPCTLRYAWVREFNQEETKKHYHAILLFNKDTWCSLGDYQVTNGSLAALIKKAWCSALHLDYPLYATLAHFPENPCYWLERNSPHFFQQSMRLKSRTNYLAKERTKQYDDGERSFGCSQY
ncbi:inovirus Gp2 family protein [Pectobacterium carotovorum subsp. carotovorum]|nr:inovirus Gp2 family protein [Pectobacterium carotovorum subsp. carotovorum]